MDRKSACFKHYIIVLITLNAVLSCLISLTWVFHTTENRNYGDYHNIPKFCVSCEDLALHPDDPRDGIEVRNVTNGNECCARNENSVPILVDKYTRQWYKEKLYTENPIYCGETLFSSNKEPVEKVYFKILGHNKRIVNEKYNSRVRWDHNSILTSSNELTYHHGYVTIQKQAVYKIYTQLLISHRKRVEMYEWLPDHVRHSIVLKRNYRGSSDEVMVYSMISQCKRDEGEAYTVSNLETTYLLQKGDRVAVQVSFPDDIIPAKNMNFFGIHMI